MQPREPRRASSPAAPTSGSSCAAPRRACPRRPRPRTRARRSASRRAPRRTPRCPRACRPPSPSPAPAPCRPRCRESCPSLRRARRSCVGEFVGLRARRRRRVERLRQPEVQHLDDAVVADLDVRRLQIAMDDALLVRRFERVGDLPGDGQRLVERQTGRRRAMQRRRASAPRPVPSRGTTSAALSSNPYRCAMLGWLSDASTCASRLKRARRSGSLATASGRTFSATSRSSFVSRAR